MDLPALLIVLGIVLMLLVSYQVGLICLIAGIVLLLIPHLRT